MKKWDKKRNNLSFCGWALVFLSSAWNVGMTMTCNRCDVMNIMWRKTQKAQKSDKERRGDAEGGWGGGGGGAGGGEEKERERESVLSFGIQIHGGTPVFPFVPWTGSLLPFPRSDPLPNLPLSPLFPRVASSSKRPGKTGVPGEKPVSRMPWKPYDINLDEGFIAIKWALCAIWQETRSFSPCTIIHPIEVYRFLPGLMPLSLFGVTGVSDR